MPPREQQPERAIRAAPWRSMDRTFVAIVATVFLFNFGVAEAIASRPRVWMDDANLADLQSDRNISRLLPLPKPKKEAPKAKLVGDVARAPTKVVRVANGNAGSRDKPTRGQMREAMKDRGLIGFINVIGAKDGKDPLSVPELTGAGGMTVRQAIEGARDGKQSLTGSGTDRRGSDTGDTERIDEPTTTGGAGERGNLGGSRKPVVIYDPDPEPPPQTPGCNPKAIFQVVKGYVTAIQNCYDVEFKRLPTLAGRVVVRITIAPNGRVTDFELEEDTVRSRALASCIERRFRSWLFPSSPQECVVEHPFVFAPAP
jgi:hypothetical protein